MSDPRFWAQTYTGGRLPFDDKIDRLSPKDIARPLSRLPRFGGHTSVMLSVAEHSLATSRIVAEMGGGDMAQMHALLHDAHEAFTGDIVAPLKRYLREIKGFVLEDFQAQLQTNIIGALGLKLLSSIDDVELIGQADLIACKVERDLFMKSAHEWDIDHLEYDRSFTCFYQRLSPAEAYSRFLKRFKELRECCE